jgi:glycosyltransferase involved in cell wall biosynthesis
MKIVGKGMSRLRENYHVPQEAQIISDAPDLVPYYEEADIMVLPIFKGSGMKVKTCESLMYGKNIIATTEALEGYDLDYDKMGARCNTAREFIDAIKSFAENPRPRFNSYCRNVFLQKYSTESVVETFRKILGKE